jgi:hypothetical protein
MATVVAAFAGDRPPGSSADSRHEATITASPSSSGPASLKRGEAAIVCNSASSAAVTPVTQLSPGIKNLGEPSGAAVQLASASRREAGRPSIPLECFGVFPFRRQGGDKARAHIRRRPNTGQSKARTSLCRHSNPSLSASANSAGKRFGEARDQAGIFGDAGRSWAAETALSRVSGGKAAESQRLFRSRQEGDVSQDCVVELAGLEPATERL